MTGNTCINSTNMENTAIYNSFLNDSAVFQLINIQTESNSRLNPMKSKLELYNTNVMSDQCNKIPNCCNQW